MKSDDTLTNKIGHSNRTEFMYKVNDTNETMKMRGALVFFAVVLVVYIRAEDCPNNNVGQECLHLACAADFHKDCVNKFCTCNPNLDNYCTHPINCTTNAHLPACWHTWHCVDEGCRCGGNFGGNFGK